MILLNLKVVTTHAKALVDTLAEKPNRIIFSGKANKLTPEAEILKTKKCCQRSSRNFSDSGAYQAVIPSGAKRSRGIPQNFRKALVADPQQLDGIPRLRLRLRSG